MNRDGRKGLKLGIRGRSRGVEEIKEGGRRKRPRKERLKWLQGKRKREREREENGRGEKSGV